MKMSATTTRKEVALRATECSQLRRAGGGDGGLIDRSPGRGISRAPPSSGGANSSSVTTSVKRWSCWAIGEVSASGAGPAQAPAGSSRARSGWRRSGGAVLGWEAAVLAFGSACAVAVIVALARRRRHEPLAFAPYLVAAIALPLAIGLPH